MSRPPVLLEVDESFLTINGTENLRELRVWRMVRVQLVVWLFFGIFFFVRGIQTATEICLLQSAILCVISLLESKCSSRCCKVAMNASLISSGVGLVLVSLCDFSLARTMFYFPVSILIASQLLGIRAAFGWMLISFLANTTYYLAAFGITDVWLHRLDELTVTCGVCACWFLCCQQGEVFFRERTRNLQDLSSHLRLKSEKLETLATTDSLTGLLNRHQFQIRLNKAVANASQQGAQMSLVVIDLNGFKAINDTLGHPVGDKSLVIVADRLRENFPDAEIARLGGDEFCLIFSNVSSAERAESLAVKASNVLDGRYAIENEFDFSLNASVGVALCPQHSISATDLFAFADTAMYFSKTDQIGHAIYEPSMTESLVTERTMLEKLTIAIEQNQFYLVYQPQVCLATNSIIGVEALLRWKCDGEMISPDKFIPLLEKSRKIVEVGEWIIWESCRQLRQWQDAGIDFSVSINLSAIQFMEEGFNETIEQPIREFNLSADRLDFEITESLLITDVDQAVERLNRIKELGASISIDDFGTGYSSLAYLRQFPIDRLKIDRAFVKDFPDRDDGVIATSIVALGKAIGLKVLAEGVETSEQLEFLKEFDCDEYQGYFFSRPISPEEIESIVKENPSNRVTPKITTTATESLARN